MRDYNVDARDIAKLIRRKKPEKPPRTQYSNIPAVQKFFDEHGPDFVQVPPWIIFRDGARLEQTGGTYGRMLPPPEDEWELCKVKEQYWAIRAEIDHEEFMQFKGYLHGTGCCPAHIYSDEQKLEHLKMLKAQAAKTRAKFLKAKRNTKDARPAWLTAKERDDAREARRKQEFMAQVDSIEL